MRMMIILIFNDSLMVFVFPSYILQVVYRVRCMAAQGGTEYRHLTFKSARSCDCAVCRNLWRCDCAVCRNLWRRGYRRFDWLYVHTYQARSIRTWAAHLWTLDMAYMEGRAVHSDVLSPTMHASTWRYVLGRNMSSYAVELYIAFLCIYRSWLQLNCT